MAEKNTLSILETIKRKMQKLDRKPQKAASKTSDDFDYISSKHEDVQISSEENSLKDSNLPKFENIETKTPQTQNEKQVNSFDDFNLYDLDLDDEKKSLQDPALLKADEQISDNDLEDQGDDTDFLEDHQEKEVEKKDDLDWLGNEIELPDEDENQKKYESFDLKNESEDELNLDEEEEEDLEEQTDEDELNLDENLDLEEEKSDEDLDLEEESNEEDLNLDEEEEENLEEQTDEDELNLDENLDLEEEKSDENLDFDEEKQEQSDEDENLENILDEADQDFENEVMGFDFNKNSNPENLQSSNEDLVKKNVQPQISHQILSDQQNNLMKNNEDKEIKQFEAEKKSEAYESTVRQVNDSVKRLIDAKNIVSGISSFSQGSAFGEIAAKLMESKLEKWCNEHLAELVEKIVSEEIKKIIPKE